MDAKELRNLQEAYMEVYASPEQLDEAEGSYGQTPKAHAAFNALRVKRENTPASKFRKSGGKTAAVDRAATHTGRSGGNHPEPGKKSPRPDDYTIRRGMTQRDRDTARQQRDYDDEGLDMYDGPDPKGPKGSLPKGKKLTRQRKTGVSAESYDLYDIILSHLLDEGYAETPEAAEAIMVNMSEEWRDDIVEEVLDEARITRGMGRRADEYNRKKEQEAYMARQNAHRERLKSDPEYRANYERMHSIHSNVKANQNEAYGSGLRSNPSRSFLQAAVNKAASAEKAKQKQNPKSRGRVRDEDDLRDRRAEAGNWKH